jgi:hypothetical protein
MTATARVPEADLWEVDPWGKPYPDIDVAQGARLAWEFLRRNSKYQKWYVGQLDSDGRLSQPYDFDGLYRFGLELPCSPAEPDASSLFRPLTIPCGVRYLSGSVGTDTLGPHEFAPVVDLSLPLDAQVDAIRHDLHVRQLCRIQDGKVARVDASPARRIKDAVLYLRILDAGLRGEKTAAIIERLYAGHTDPYDTLKKDRKAAHAHRDGGYRRLATGG